MKRTGLLILSGMALIAIVTADGTGSNAGRRTAAGGGGSVRGGAETGLIGIKLYDTGIDVVRRYGNPDDVINVTGGAGGAVGPAGGAGRPAAGAAGAGGRGGGASGTAGQAEWNLPPTIPDWNTIGLFQDVPTAAGAGAGGGQGGGAPTAAGAGPGGGQGGGQGGGAQAGQDSRIVYTRWVYKRGNSRFGFILNRYGQVIQIEAIGSNDARVFTNRGIRYGAKFADIINRYGIPDAYEINGNSLVLRYLVNNKVAFRLNRLKDDAPHVVTGIVVAAGKM